jgi:hypothetical protein
VSHFARRAGSALPLETENSVGPSLFSTIPVRYSDKGSSGVFRDAVGPKRTSLQTRCLINAL